MCIKKIAVVLIGVAFTPCHSRNFIIENLLNYRNHLLVVTTTPI